MVVEAVGGFLSGSLALLADAAHMMTDAGALALAVLAQHLAFKPADHKRTYGYGRFRVLAAFTNGITLILITGWIVIQAIVRLFEPHEIQSLTMLGVALIGLVINLVVLKILSGTGHAHHGHIHQDHLHDHDDDHVHHQPHDDLNVSASRLHVMADMWGSLGAIMAALTIMGTGWHIIDPILSVIMASLIVSGAIRLLRKSGHILLEGVPDGIDPDAIRTGLMKDIEGLSDVHNLHVWSNDEASMLATLHAVAKEGVTQQQILEAVQKWFLANTPIRHVTIQTEQDCPNERKSCC